MAAPFQSRSLLSQKNTRKVVIVSAVYVALSLVHLPFSYGQVTYPNGDIACTAFVTGSSSAATYYFSKIRPWQVGNTWNILQRNVVLRYLSINFIAKENISCYVP